MATKKNEVNNETTPESKPSTIIMDCKKEFDRIIGEIDPMAYQKPRLGVIQIGKAPKEAFIDRILSMCDLYNFAYMHVQMSRAEYVDTIYHNVNKLLKKSMMRHCDGIAIFMETLTYEYPRFNIDPTDDIAGTGPLAAYKPLAAQVIHELLRIDGTTSMKPDTSCAVITNASYGVTTDSFYTYQVNKVIEMLSYLKAESTVVVDEYRIRSTDIAENADVVISMVGNDKSVETNYIKKGATIIDLGAFVGNSGAILGDVIINNESQDVTLYPASGIEALAAAILLRNTYTSYKENTVGPFNK